jgi:outer membrane protein assembly factor BamB
MKSVWLALVCIVAGCQASPFSFSLRDTKPQPLPTPAQAASQPAAQEAYLAGKGEVLAWDVRARRLRYRVAADVASRIVLGPSLFVYADRAGNMVARERKNGALRWQFSLGKRELIGMAVGTDSVFVTTAEPLTGRSDRRFWIEAWDGQKGHNRWSHEARLPIGAPVLTAGRVLVPYARQWLVVFAEGSGALEARMRSADLEVAFVAARDGELFFGSRQVLRRIGDAPVRVSLPPGLARAAFERDAFDAVEARYSAHDRARILWQPESLASERVVVHLERYLFALNARTGQLRWARALPQPIVSAIDTGPSILYATADGTLGALGQNGEAVQIDPLGTPLVGVTFDVRNLLIDTAGAEVPNTRNELIAIAKDRDSRYRAIQTYAVSALAAQPALDAATDLLAVIDEPSVAELVRSAAETALVELESVDALPALLDSLRARPSYLQGKRPRATAAAAAAMARLTPSLSAEQKQDALFALTQCLEHPATDQAALPELIRALHALDRQAGVLPIRRFVMTYRTDPAFARDPQALEAAFDVLCRSEEAWNREIVTFTATDPRTQLTIRDMARSALAR